jgi:hypothetical protein
MNQYNFEDGFKVGMQEQKLKDIKSIKKNLKGWLHFQSIKDTLKEINS